MAYYAFSEYIKLISILDSALCKIYNKFKIK